MVSLVVSVHVSSCAVPTGMSTEDRISSHVKVVSVTDIAIRNNDDFPFLPFIAVTTKICFEYLKNYHVGLDGTSVGREPWDVWTQGQLCSVRWGSGMRRYGNGQSHTARGMLQAGLSVGQVQTPDFGVPCNRRGHSYRPRNAHALPYSPKFLSSSPRPTDPSASALQVSESSLSDL